MAVVLITGGAGYIGSHVNKLLNSLGQSTVVCDSLVTGHRDFLRWGEFFKADLGDRDALNRLFRVREVSAVMHFASFISVGESVADPHKYYLNNLRNTINLLDAMRAHEVETMIFSSTAAVYGEPKQKVITEGHALNPISPYARSKVMIEQIMNDYTEAYGMKQVSLRYFNAAGADSDLEIGERHKPETHLIPLLIECALGLRDEIEIFGTDYSTPDGTCIRDYIHVSDLAQAHVNALDYLKGGGESRAFNLGNGKGFSVRQVIETVEKVTGKKIKVKESERRPGDSPVLVGGSKLAKSTLGWKPTQAKLEKIVNSAWEWHQKDLLPQEEPEE